MPQCKFSWKIVKTIINNDFKNWCEKAVWLNLNFFNENIFIKWLYKDNNLECSVNKNINYLDKLPEIWENFFWIFEEKIFLDRKDINLINYWETIYNESSLDLCKSNIQENYNTSNCIVSLKVKKILISESDCWEIIEIRLNDWIKDYIIRWTIKWEWIWWYIDWTNNNEIKYSCDNNKYTFDSNPNYKIWDELYIVANSYNLIISEWKDIYNKNLDKNICSISPFWISIDNFKWYENCKLKWKVDYVKYVENPEWYNCSFNINLQVSNENWKYFISTKEHFLYDKSWLYICLWSTQTIFPIEKNINWKIQISELPKIWEESYFIINNETKELIWYWEDEYLNSTLIECSIDKEKQSFSLTWWLSKNEVTQKRIDFVLWLKMEQQNQNSINPVLEQNQINTNIDMENESKIDNNDIKIETKPIKDYNKNIDTIVKIDDIKKNEDTKISQYNQDNSMTGTITSTWIIKHEEVIQNKQLNKETNYNYLFWIGGILLIILWIIIYKKFKK